MFGTNAYAQAPFAAAGGNAFFVSTSESTVASDAIAAAATFPVSFSDTASGADVASLRFLIWFALSEAATGADTTAGFTAVASLSESAAVSGAPAAVAIFSAPFSDGATTSDTLLSLSNFTARAAESASVGASELAANQTFTVSISESAFGLDALLGLYLWEPIDDTQTAGWTDILRPTIIEDISGFGGANFGVLAFAGNLRQAYNPNPVIWSDVDDSSDTTWTDIVAV